MKIISNSYYVFDCNVCYEILVTRWRYQKSNEIVVRIHYAGFRPQLADIERIGPRKFKLGLHIRFKASFFLALADNPQRP